MAIFLMGAFMYFGYGLYELPEFPELDRLPDLLGLCLRWLPLLLEFPLSDRLPDRLPDRWLEFRDEEFPDDCPVGWDFGFFARFGFESLIGRELGRS